MRPQTQHLYTYKLLQREKNREEAGKRQREKRIAGQREEQREKTRG
jgi:hypothetical protein